MRKACINLDGTFKMAWLISGDLGTGQTLHYVELSNADHTYDPTPEEWHRGLDECYQKAAELKYEVSRVRGLAFVKEQ
ncbi:hypothetical protein [Aeromonas veronii]|uniref:hypothetical protein n=1 Tax=Aeromonas veronii TaxID=654 RepID=UPI0005AB13CB|nr:hypothetical protein [Aeromonas veronii]